MKQLISQLILQLLNTFDLIFMFIANVLTYLIIKFIDTINKYNFN